MPTTFTPRLFWADLEAQIKAIWPEVTGIRSAEHTDRIPWLALTPPFAAYVKAPWGLAPVQPMDCRIRQTDTQVFYVAESEGPSDDIEAKMAAFLNALWGAQAITQGQVREAVGPDVSDDLSPNMQFLEANRPNRAGAVTLTIWLTEAVS